jgi:HEAT repeat protein
MLDEPMDDYDQYITEMANETENYGVARNALWNGGPKAVDALIRGLSHPRAKLRQTSLAVMDHLGDQFEPRCYEAILPLLEDEISKVRRAAVHAISCQHCHPAPEEIDVPSLLIEKLENDSSISVRRAAIRALAEYSSDSRSAGAARELLAGNEADPDLVRWAENIIRRTKYMTPSRMAPLAPETVSPSGDHRRQEPT